MFDRHSFTPWIVTRQLFLPARFLLLIAAVLSIPASTWADTIPIEQNTIRQATKYAQRSTLIAQIPSSIQRIDVPQIPPQDIPRTDPVEPQPEQTPLQLPPNENLLPQPVPTQPSPEAPSEAPSNIFVRQFEIVGSTVFSPEELAEATKQFTGRNLTFAELLQARSAITQLYVSRGYVTSATILPPQTLDKGLIKIEVIEGSINDINVTGTRRLSPGYIRSRMKLVTSTPVNVNRLLEGLRLLQLDPLIETISADLQAGTQLGTSLLQVNVSEAKTQSLTPSVDNNRLPSVGSLRRQVELSEANLLGFGDALRIGYANTDGSNGLYVNYTVPLNPRNGTLNLAYGNTDSKVIEEPFERLDIQADSRYYELTYRQPLIQRPSEELALGLAFSRLESQTELGIDDIGPYPLSPGADEEGRTRISALRFFQDWVQRDSRQVFALRSQFSFGLDLLNSTINNNDAPDSRFFAWRGQGQWTRLLAPDTLFLVRGDLQLADRALVPLEQVGIGGQETVRGYRQDALLTDSSFIFSSEIRLPILRTGNSGILQLTPFIDIGTGWNHGNDDDSDSGTLVGTGVGLLWRQGNNFSARLDFGIPLISIDSNSRTWQEDGIYFSIRYNPSF